MALDPAPFPVLRNLPSQNAGRAVVAKVALAAAGIAVAIAVAVAIRGGWSADERGVAAVEPPTPRAAEPVPAVPAPPPAPVARPEPRSGAREERVARPKPVRIASFAPAPAPVPREDSFARRPGAIASAGPVDPQCVPRALKARRDLAHRFPTKIAVRFPVAASGAVGRIEVLGEGTDGEVVAAMQDAVRSCAFNPGSDEYGRAELQSVTMRITYPRGASSR